MTILTHHQKFFSYRNTFNLYHNFIIAARTSQLISTFDFEKALDELLDQRLLLRSNVNLKNFTLRELPEVHARDCYAIIPDIEGLDDRKGIMQVCMDIHAKLKFDLNVYYPLWKIFIYKDWYILAMDHTLYDGTTAMNVLNDLFLLIGGHQIEQEEDVEIVNLNYEVFLDVSFWQIGKVVFQEVLKPKLHKFVQDFLNFNKFYRNNDWFKLKDEEARINTFRSLNHLMTIPNSRLKPILKILKQKKLSFQTLLNYIIVKTFNSFAPSNSIKITIPVNLRKFLNISPQTYGLFVTETTIPVTPSVCHLLPSSDPNAKINWNLLSHLESYLSLTNQLQRKSLIAALRYISASDHYNSMNKSLKAIHSSTIEFSNLRAPSNAFIDEWIFSQTADDFSVLFPCSVISNETCTNITLVGNIAMINNGIFEKFIKEFEMEFNGVLTLFENDM